MPSSSPALVLIHGRGDQGGRTASELKRDWLAALQSRGDPALDSQSDAFLAFYRDEFYGPPAGGQTVPSALLASVNPPAAEDTPTLTYLMGRVQQDFVPAGETVAAAQALPQESADFIVDTLRYFGDDSYYNRVNGHLLQALNKAGQRRKILIAHSMGCIIAYEVLATHNIALDTLITIGCPLAWSIDVQGKLPLWLQDGLKQSLPIPTRFQRSIQRIQDRLKSLWNQVFLDAAAEARLHRQGLKFYPPNVERWFNVYDPDDGVAYLRAPVGGIAFPGISDPNLADDFRMPDGSERVLDIVIHNPERPDFHSATGYLQSRQVIQLVNDAWQRS